MFSGLKWGDDEFVAGLDVDEAVGEEVGVGGGLASFVDLRDLHLSEDAVVAADAEDASFLHEVGALDGDDGESFPFSIRPFGDGGDEEGFPDEAGLPLVLIVVLARTSIVRLEHKSSSLRKMVPAKGNQTKKPLLATISAESLLFVICVNDAFCSRYRSSRANKKCQKQKVKRKCKPKATKTTITRKNVGRPGGGGAF